MKTFPVPGTSLEFVVKTSGVGQWNLSVWVGGRALLGSAYGNLPMPSDAELVAKGHAIYRRERNFELAELRQSGVERVADAAEQEVA